MASENRFERARRRRAEVIDIVEASEHRMTVRQVYYQMVAANKILSGENPYGNIEDDLVLLRRNGTLDWELIEDRSRVPVFRGGEHKDILSGAEMHYRLDHWATQGVYVEL